ncbi:hypothetical protein B0I35DRAFT_434703 [Stachybotrys elegans]|uniref:Rhodopsin domain-containing protein n=1 Tax=Stachybotrys elegans TaxID=80388 RepID=A0A8K0SQZ0_9HYPO|nr:hypothetical protein B0I35DRAFT_434703 [Stachybotrys elegans]
MHMPKSRMISATMDSPVGLWSHTRGRSKTVFLTALVFPVFAVPIVFLRCWTSHVILGKWHLDDTLAVISLVFALGQSIMHCIQSRLGGGDHVSNISPAGLSLLLKTGKYAAGPFYNLTTFFTKASVLAFYLRFSVQRSFHFCVYALTVIVGAYSITNIITVLVLDCHDREACHIIYLIFDVTAALNIAADIAILLLPFWILHPMTISAGRKFAIALVLMAGGFVVAVSIVRLVATIIVDNDPDPTYSWGLTILLSLIESWAGLICACLPCLMPFWARYFPNFTLRRFSLERNQRQLRSIGTSGSAA